MEKWKTKEGEVIAIKDMSCSHIQNSINMLKRLLDTRPEEAIYSGDSFPAEQAVEHENRQNEELAGEIQDKINTLQAELNSR